MNDNVPESERWVPVKAGGRMTLGDTEDHLPDQARARREAEAVIAKAFARQIDP